MKKLFSLFFATLYSFCLFGYSILMCPQSVTFSTQAEVNDFPIQYPDCIDIEGDVIINGSDINDLSPLSNLETIGGDLEIGQNNVYTNEQLTNLSGLENLITIGEDLRLFYNMVLSDISALSNLQFIGDAIMIEDNPTLSSIAALGNIIEIGELCLRLTPLITTLTELISLSVIRDEIDIDESNLSNLAGLENITSLNEDLNLSNNESLVSLEGLENLVKVAKEFTIKGNDMLIDLTGVESLDSVGTCRIQNNSLLETLHGLNHLSYIGGDSYLSGYTYIAGNDILTCISALNPATLATGQLSIVYNPQLSFCASEFTCEFIANSDETIFVEGNAPGCNNETEIQSDCDNQVEDPCFTVGIETKIDNPFKLTLSPNPSYGQFSLKTNNNSLKQLSVSNPAGIVLFERSFLQDTNFDLSDFPSGIYYITVSNEVGITTLSVVKF